MTGCLGYALVEFVRVRDAELPVPTVEIAQRDNGGGSKTFLTFDYDSRRTVRSTMMQIAATEAFEAAAQYIEVGTPAAKTSRKRPVGTRAVDGIGPVRVVFQLRRAEEETEGDDWK